MKIMFSLVAAMICASTSARSLSNQEKALQFMNHITFMVAKINAYGTTTELEEIYNQHLSDRLGLDYVVDERAMIAIKQILYLLNELRMNEGDRNVLAQELEMDRQAALYRAIPSPQALVAANPLAIGVNLLQGALSGYASYKIATAEIEKRGLKRNWELDKEKLKALNEYNMELVDCFWRLVDKYKIEYSRQHVTTEDINGLFACIKDADVDERKLVRAESYLQNYVERFEHFPSYWYYRGVVAQRLGKDEDALCYYAKYRDRRLPIFVHDKMYVDCAIAELTLRKKIGKYGWFTKSDVESLILVVERNCEQTDWERYLFAGLAASDMLDDTRLAKRLVEKATYAAEKVYRDTWEKCGWNEDACEDGELYKLPSADAVITCKETWMNVIKDRQDVLDGLSKTIAKGVGNDRQSALETMRLAMVLRDGGRGIGTLMENAVRDLGFRIRYERNWIFSNRVRIKMPVSWVYAKRCKYTISLFDADGNPVGEEADSRLGTDHQFGKDGECLIEFVFNAPKHSEVKKVRFLKLCIRHDLLAYSMTFAFPQPLSAWADVVKVGKTLAEYYSVSDALFLVQYGKMMVSKKYYDRLLESDLKLVAIEELK